MRRSGAATLGVSLLACLLVPSAQGRDLASGLRAVEEAPIPFSEFHTVRQLAVGPALALGANETPFVFANEGTGVIYSLTPGGGTNVLDLATGELLQRVESPPTGFFPRQNGGVAIRHDDRSWFVVSLPRWLNEERPNLIYDATNPRRLELKRLAPSCGRGVIALPGVGAAVTIGVCAKVFDLDSGVETSILFDSNRTGFANLATMGAVGGDPSAPILALYLIDNSVQRTYYRITRVADPHQPEILAEIPTEFAPTALWVDRTGQFVIDQDGTGLVRIRSTSGALLSTIRGFDHRSAVAFADGPFGRVLVLLSGSELQFFDLADPRDPTLRGTSTIDWTAYPTVGPTVQRVQTLSTKPWMIVVHQSPNGIDVFDVRTGSRLERYEAIATRPTAVAVDETVRGGPLVGVLGFEPEITDWVDEGTLLRLDSFQLKDSGRLEPLASFSTLSPDVARAIAPIDGRYLAILDLAAGVLAVTDTSSGEVVARTRVEAPGWSSAPQHHILRFAGDTILAGDHYDLEVFGWQNGALVKRRTLLSEQYSGEYTDVALSPSGALALARGGRIRFFAPDGQESTLSTFIYPIVHVEFSPDGNLLLASDDSFNPGYSIGLTVYDVSDPHFPRTLWIGPYSVSHGRFARRGATILANDSPVGYGLGPVQIDSRTGRQLANGAPWQESYGSLYYAQNLLDNSSPRFTFVTRTGYGQWFAAHFDPSYDTPQSLGDTGPYPFKPTIVARSDGRAWYEGYGDPEGGSAYQWLQFTVDGGSGALDVGGASNLIPLRHGFFLAQPHPWSSGSLAPFLLRDYALNRPPVADPGPAQTVECNGDREAIAILDGTGSDDPDSTPGTDDDLQSAVWYDSDKPVGEGLRLSTRLSLGRHDLLLELTDTVGAKAEAKTSVTVVDTHPPQGEIVSPKGGVCLGPAALPVTVADNFADVCEPTVQRSYDPPPGPPYSQHGDYQVTLTTKDTSNNAATATVDFTIDTKPPVVELLSPPDRTLLVPSVLPFSLVFQDNDEDGATGGILHELIKLQGCTIYDGLTYGDGDGILTDEVMQLTQVELCRLSALCGFTVLSQPELRVEATDCGGNVGMASHTLIGSITLRPGICGQ